jgi:hypothetical protein
MLEPQWQHDCSGCIFLGQVGSKDVWQCDGIDLILRHGSSPEENASLPVDIVRLHRRHIPEWNMALQLFDAYMLGRERALVR